jgi:transcriptional regulator NrdR family protein
MDCPYCTHPNPHKHGRTSKGSQRYKCPSCQRTFTETLDTLYYRRQLLPAEIEQILQSQTEGSSLRGMSRITKRAYNTVVSIVDAASYRAQLVHNQQVQAIETQQIAADEMWSFCQKKQKQCRPGELEAGDCWIGISLEQCSGLILSARVGKHTDEFLEALIVNTEGKTDCKD